MNIVQVRTSIEILETDKEESQMRPQVLSIFRSRNFYSLQ